MEGTSTTDQLDRSHAEKQALTKQEEAELKPISKKEAKFIQYQILLEKYFQGISSHNLQKSLATESLFDYISELDMSFGDIIMIFPNPDHPDMDQNEHATLKINGIPFLSEGINFKIHNAQDQLKKKAFIRAFGQAFRSLSKVSAQQLKEIQLQQKIQKEKEKNFSNQIQGSKIMQYIENIKKFWNNPKIFYGGRFLMCDDLNDPKEWIRQKNQPTKDFATLIRNTILLKLQIDGGYRVRQFLSSNGKKIYAVLYSNQQNIQRFAQQLQFNHLLTPEFTDILSFEPVDSRFRPLRVNLLFRNETKDDLIKQYFPEKQRAKAKEIIANINQ